MTYYIYLTKLPDGKMYIGQHKWVGTGKDPDYIGSGVAIDRYRTPELRNLISTEILEFVENLEELSSREVYWIKKYQLEFGELILNKRAAGSCTNTSETVSKLWQDPAYRKKQSDSHKGGTSHTGYRLNDEQKKRLSESHKGQVAWNTGLTGERRPLYRFQKPDGSIHTTPTPNKTKHYHPDWVFLGLVEPTQDQE